MIVLTGFGDEIGPDIIEQMDVMASEGVKHIELRGVDNKSVMALSQQECADLKKKLDDQGFGISAIGSPIGKVKIDDDFDAHMDDFKHALELAKFFESKYIRLFTYYPPEGEDINKYRDEVMRRMGLKAELAGKAEVILLSENESNLYGESPRNCADVIETLNSPWLKAIFDPANFVLKGYKPFEDCWPLLKKHTVYFHIKDAKTGPGEKITPAGQGDGQIKEILADAVADGFEGFASLEPHLSHGGQFGGFTGPDLFKDAIRALKKVLDEVGAEY